MAEFQRLQQAGIDPESGEPFADSTELMRSALESNVPQDNEALLAFWNPMAEKRYINRIGMYQVFGFVQGKGFLHGVSCIAQKQSA